MTLVLTSPNYDRLYPVLLENNCTRVVYLLQRSALCANLCNWRAFGSYLVVFPPPGEWGKEYRALRSWAFEIQMDQAVNLV
jgi:hypothetical protein